MATIKDVARMAGVSTTTISKYINGGNVRAENAAAIRTAIDALDFRVNHFARGLKTQRSRSIGILLPDMTAPFYGTVLMSMDRAFREHGYHSLVSCYGSSHGLERDNLRFLLSTGIDGLVYVPEDLTAEEYAELTANSAIPMVQVDRMIQGVPSDTVLVNNSDSVYHAVSRLIGKGHRRISIITGPKSVFSAKERLVGYLRALSDHGILYDSELVICDENTFATGYRGYETLMSLKDRPTAVFTTNYNITMGLVTAAHDRGIRIPDELDIFGFDCVDICSMMQPPLPVVYQPEQEIGRTAAVCLIERLTGYSGNPRIIRLPCTITPEEP